MIIFDCVFAVKKRIHPVHARFGLNSNVTCTSTWKRINDVRNKIIIIVRNVIIVVIKLYKRRVEWAWRWNVAHADTTMTGLLPSVSPSVCLPPMYELTGKIEITLKWILFSIQHLRVPHNGVALAGKVFIGITRVNCEKLISLVEIDRQDTKLTQLDGIKWNWNFFFSIKIA